MSIVSSSPVLPTSSVATTSADAASAAAAAAAAPAPAPAAPAAPSFTKGQLVAFSYEDPWSGPTTQQGIVFDVLENGQYVIGWFAGLSGGIPEDSLTAA